jgi:DNA-binding NarL/FixJ family response regulator
MKKISILLVDDHLLLREMWTTVLNNDQRLHVTHSTGNGAEAVAIANQEKPDIILMDVAMAPLDGIILTREITSRPTTSKIIGVSMYNIAGMAKRMMLAGAKGYLTKNASWEELITAILEVNAGRHFMGAEIKEYISLDKFAVNGKASLHQLTSREIEILLHLKKGLSSKEVAAVLHVGYKTVEVHRYHILKKLQLGNTASLVNFANTNGL